MLLFFLGAATRSRALSLLYCFLSRLCSIRAFCLLLFLFLRFFFWEVFEPCLQVWGPSVGFPHVNVCVCIYTHTNIYIYIYYMHIFISLYIYVYMYTYKSLCVYIYIGTDMYANLCIKFDVQRQRRLRNS